MPYPALAIANYFVDRALIEGEAMDHLRLQKLVYLAHGWNLAVREEPLIQEPVEAWKYGPVVPSVYKVFKKYGNDQILENGILFGPAGPSVPSVEPGDSRTLQVLNRVWEVYKPYSGVQLSNMTHDSGTPWETTWEGSKGSGKAKIDRKVIEEHFRRKAQEGRRAG